MFFKYFRFFILFNPPPPPPKVATDCLRMRDEFPEIASQLTVRMVDGATHAFDWPSSPPPAFSPFAKAQTGGMVAMRYSAKETECRGVLKYSQQ